MWAIEHHRQQTLQRAATRRLAFAAWHLLCLSLATSIDSSHAQTRPSGLDADLTPSSGLTLRVRTPASLRATPAASSPAPSVVTDADIEQARRVARQPSQSEIDAARKRLDRVPPALSQSPLSPPAPRIDALPKPAAGVDLEKLARDLSSRSQEPTVLGATQQPGLLVFVSLSMPRPTLERLVEQAARAQGSLVLRGLVGGSLRETAAQVQPLLKGKQVALQIDPVAFDRFSITRVPAFVLVRDGARPQSCASGTCAPPEHFLRVTGDVSLDYALRYMHSSAPAFRGDAAGFIARLSGGRD